MLAALFYAIVFAALKWFGVIAISWWWILLAAILLQVPLAKTVVFVVFKLCGLFAMPVSWWFIIIPIVLDFIGLGQIVADIMSGDKK